MVAAMAMAEIADEELNGIVPRVPKIISSEFQDIGYYKDERGYTRFGVIPKYNQNLINASWNLEDGKNIISNPRYR